MSKYFFSCGEDNFPKDNREYVLFDTDKGKQTAIALETIGVPYVGTFTEEQMRFFYDPDYKDTVEEIIGKAKSWCYARKYGMQIDKLTRKCYNIWDSVTI